MLLAAGLALPASAARPRAGSWSGESAQSLAISFRVTAARRSIRALEVEFRARCSGGGETSGTTTFAGPFPVRSGEFRVRGGPLTVRGTFEEKALARGRLRWRGRSYRPDGSSRSCDSGRVRWTAKR